MVRNCTGVEGDFPLKGHTCGAYNANDGKEGCKVDELRHVDVYQNFCLYLRQCVCVCVCVCLCVCVCVLACRQQEQEEEGGWVSALYSDSFFAEFYSCEGRG